MCGLFALAVAIPGEPVAHNFGLLCLNLGLLYLAFQVLSLVWAVAHVWFLAVLEGLLGPPNSFEGGLHGWTFQCSSFLCVMCVGYGICCGTPQKTTFEGSKYRLHGILVKRATRLSLSLSLSRSLPLSLSHSLSLPLPLPPSLSPTHSLTHTHTLSLSLSYIHIYIYIKAC